MSEDIMGIFMIIIAVVGICVVLPIMIVWIINKRKAHEIDKQTEILMAMLEKHPDLDPAEVMKKLNVFAEIPACPLLRRPDGGGGHCAGGDGEGVHCLRPLRRAAQVLHVAVQNRLQHLPRP